MEFSALINDKELDISCKKVMEFGSIWTVLILSDVGMETVAKQDRLVVDDLLGIVFDHFNGFEHEQRRTCIWIEYYFIYFIDIIVFILERKKIFLSLCVVQRHSLLSTTDRIKKLFVFP